MISSVLGALEILTRDLDEEPVVEPVERGSIGVAGAGVARVSYGSVSGVSGRGSVGDALSNSNGERVTPTSIRYTLIYPDTIITPDTVIHPDGVLV